MYHSFGSHGCFAFVPHIAVFLGLIALGVGYWVCKEAKDGSCKWGKFVGYFISIVAACGLLCSFYLILKNCYKAQCGLHSDHSMEMMMPPADQNHPQN